MMFQGLQYTNTSFGEKVVA